MTPKDAIKNLKKLKSFHNGSYGTAIDLAIKALEQQPCEDCISLNKLDDIITKAIDDSENQTECQTLRWVLDVMSELPSVTPNQKVGRWIKWYEILKCDGYVDHLPHWKCSECEQEVSPYSAGFINYCPNCGAKMEVEDENKTK